MSEMIGEVVGSYRIVSPLGAGGMGAVWLAEHTLLGRRVAIKFLHPEVSQSQAVVERFFAEARAATKIANPGIVVVYDFGWHTNNRAYIVMEHLAGESLAARLQTRQVSLTSAVHAVEQAAMAMAVAHARGIIHRDLKPDNIFVIPDAVAPGGERIKLLDFGIAKLIGDEHGNPTRTRTGLIMGTPMYMSPEQCRGAGDIDHRTDIYALGCVLFHLLCGRPPFFAATPGDMIAAHLREVPQPPSSLAPDVPPAIDAIVLRCLAKAAGDRYATMTELVRDLRAATGSDTAVPTIVPLRAPARAVETVYSQGPLSTLAGGAGESVVRPARPARRIGLVLAALLALTLAIVLVRTRSSPAPARVVETVPDAPPPVDALPDAAVDAAIDAPIDAPVDAPPSDASPPDVKRPARRRPSYDPFDHR